MVQAGAEELAGWAGWYAPGPAASGDSGVHSWASASWPDATGCGMKLDRSIKLCLVSGPAAGSPLPRPTAAALRGSCCTASATTSSRLRLAWPRAAGGSGCAAQAFHRRWQLNGGRPPSLTWMVALPWGRPRHRGPPAAGDAERPPAARGRLHVICARAQAGRSRGPLLETCPEAEGRPRWPGAAGVVVGAWAGGLLVCWPSSRRCSSCCP
jgi:hypothetical protein